jgi:O-antigen/teichoic acid export membrane protein
VTSAALAPRRRIRLSGLRRSIATTAASNVASAAAAGVAGIVIARALGPSARGEYAAVLAWFGIVLTVGQLGQTAATTFFVAQEPLRARDYVATSRTMMAASGAVVLSVGVLAAPLLASGSEALLSGYRLMFVTCLASFVGASYTFSLQAVDISRWNLVRLAQPVMFLAAIGLLHTIGRLSLIAVLTALSATILAQAVVAYLVCRRQQLSGGQTRSALTAPLARYGLGQLAAALPSVVIARLDLVVLSLVAAPSALGHYAVAASLTTLAVPLVSAVGNVAFPRLAAQGATAASSRRLQRWAVLGSAAVGVMVIVPLTALSPWIVPAVFGEAYRGAVWLVVLLAPGGVFLACGQVCGDLLRGHGRPLAVARVQAMAATLTVALLAVLVPTCGVAGAAVANSAAAGVALVLMMGTLRRLTGAGGGR